MKWFHSKVSGLVLNVSDVVALEPVGAEAYSVEIAMLQGNQSTSCYRAILRLGGSYIIYPEEITEFLTVLTGQPVESYNEGVTHLFPR